MKNNSYQCSDGFVTKTISAATAKEAEPKTKMKMTYEDMTHEELATTASRRGNEIASRNPELASELKMAAAELQEMVDNEQDSMACAKRVTDLLYTA